MPRRTFAAQPTCLGKECRQSTRLGRAARRVRRSLRRVAPPKTNGNGNAHRDESSLSPREREILTLLAEGRTQSQIAATLVISSKTVATHIQHILAKLGVHTRAQAVAMAFRTGLVEPEVRAHLLADESIVFAHEPVAVD